MDAASQAFEVKGTVSSLTVLRLRTADVDAIEADLVEKIRPFPQIFNGAPVVIDAAFLDGKPLPWEAIARILRASKLVPVAAANVPAAETDPAVSAGFGIVQLGSRMRTLEPEPDAPAPVAAAGSSPVTVAETATDTATATVTATVTVLEPLLVAQPVRGGQVVYARGVDLVARAPVNAGAQVIADGHVHVYGPLRGRALAGAQGMADARVFCQSLEAELVSVGGEFLTADDIPQKLRGKPAQIFVEHGSVRVAAL